MIIKFEQLDRQPNPIFEGKIGDKLIVEGKGDTRHSDAYLVFGQRDRFTMPNKPHSEYFNGVKATQIIDIEKDNMRVGYIHPVVVVTKKKWLFSLGWCYFNFVFEDKQYSVYDVGLGRGNHYICVYENGETVAIIWKDDEKINSCDKYTIYALDDKKMRELCIMALYYDCTFKPDYGVATNGKTYENDSFLTLQKELLEKYDPTFIPKVKAQEGITEETN